MSQISGLANLNSMLQDRISFGEISHQSKGSSGASPVSIKEQGPSFEDTLKATLGEVNETIKTADSAAKNFAIGKADNLHDVMISMEKADVALRTLTAVRGKLVEAYQEIMRMPV